MAMIVETLPDDPIALKKIILELQKKNDFLMEQFRLARQKRFGASSEVSPEQEELFNEVEQVADVAEAPETKEIASHTRKKPARAPLPKDLPRETRIIYLPEAEKVCDCCRGPMHEMGKETREQLEFVPASIKVIETIRLKYSCRTCEKDNTHTSIKIAPPPASPIPKGIATASLLAQIIINKYQYALPLYRQETLFKNYGIDLNRKTMADWALNHIQKLYALESQIKEMSAEQKLIQRQKHAAPLLIKFKSWLDQSLLTVAPESALGTALAYCANQWVKLIRYVEDGRLSIDNNRAERAIKPFVIGRKNWLFSNTASGANASAVLYSLIETAKSNGIEPLSYLQRLFDELPRRDEHNDIDDLMPWNFKG